MKCKDCNLLIQKIRENVLSKASDGKWIQNVVKEMNKKGTKGKFAEWCGGKVTRECIERGLRSKDPKIRKRAQLAKNFLEMRKKEYGGETANNTVEQIAQMREIFKNKLQRNNYINMLHDIAQQGMDLEDAYDDLIASYGAIVTIQNKLYNYGK